MNRSFMITFAPFNSLNIYEYDNIRNRILL